MLARRVEFLLRKYIRVTEQVEDLGEPPAIPLTSEEGEPDASVSAKIDKEVLEDRENRLKELLVELFGNDKIELNKEVDFAYIVDFDGDKVSLSFKVVDGEGIAVLVDKGLPCTISFTPFFRKTFSSVLDLVDELVENEDALKELVSVVRKVVGVVDEEETAPPEGSEEKEQEQETTSESKIMFHKLRLKRIAEKLKEAKKLMKEVSLQEQEEDEKKDFEVKKVADTEVNYTQMELPMEGEIAAKALERMKLADITRKVSENPSTPYPDIIGFVQEPKEV